MQLFLRRVHHSQATDNYRVVFDGVEVGSVGQQIGALQRQFWAWGIDTVLPRQPFATSGEGRDRDDCTAQFKATWEVFCSEPDRLAQFLQMKRGKL